MQSSNTEVFLHLLHFKSQLKSMVYLDISTGNHRRIVCTTDLDVKYGQEYCEALFGLHAFLAVTPSALL